MVLEILNQVGQLILSLSILVVLHELGHFIPAKLFKTRVEKFYLFFDPWFSIFKKKVGETTYGIGWLPLGGYVKISGMIDESMDKEALKKDPEPWEFRSKPAWQRLIIMLGGVTVNAILAVIIYVMVMFVYGKTVIPNKSITGGIWVPNKEFSKEIGLQTGDKILEIEGVKYEEQSFEEVIQNLPYAKKVKVERAGEVVEVQFPSNFIEILSKYKDAEGQLFDFRRPFEVGAVKDSSNAKKAGILEGDIIVKINNTPVRYFDEFKDSLNNNKNKIVQLTVKRNNQEKLLPVQVSGEGIIGFEVAQISDEELKAKKYYEVKNVEYTLLEAIPAGFNETLEKLSLYTKGVAKIFDFESKAYKSAGGFKAFGSMFSKEWNWEIFWRNTAFISIILAFMNLLPIPALDGGHVMFLSYEMITGRKPHEKLMEYAQIAGMIFLLALVVLSNLNDWI